MREVNSLLDYLCDEEPAAEIRIVIAGCRDYFNYREAEEFIDMCLPRICEQRTPVILSGGCRGADMLGERYAHEHGYRVERYEADWDRYGKSAGPRRNRQMAEAADAAICFWDGVSRGTESLINSAMERGIRVFLKGI